MSQVFELMDAQENLGREIMELRIKLAAKDIKLVHLKMHNQMLSSEWPCATEELVAENSKLQSKVVELTCEIQGQNANVKVLTKHLLDAHDAENAIMKILIKFLHKASLYLRHVIPILSST